MLSRKVTVLNKKVGFMEMMEKSMEKKWEMIRIIMTMIWLRITISEDSILVYNSFLLLS